MAQIHRYGIPPKNLPHRKVRWFCDRFFDEDGMTQWVRDHLKGRVQYDVTVFAGNRGSLNATTVVMLWFASASDARLFESWGAR